MMFKPINLTTGWFRSNNQKREMCCQKRPDVPELLRHLSAWQGLKSLAGHRRMAGEGVLYFCREVLHKISPLLCFLYQIPKEEGLLFVNLSAMIMLVELKT